MRTVGESGPIVWPGGKLYVVTFNNGYAGPRIIHWMIGAGTPQAVDSFVLSDRNNEVKGLPTIIDARQVDGYRVNLYRFPMFPAGGPFGSHEAALVNVGEFVVIASVHGYGHLSTNLRLALAYAAQWKATLP